MAGWRFLVYLTAVTLFTQEITAYRVVCVYTNWAQFRQDNGRFLPEDVDPFLCTHIIFAYAKLKGNRLVATEWNDEGTPWNDGMYDRVTGLKQTNPELKVLLGAGGWNMGSKDFSRMSARLGSRRLFAKTSVKFLRDRNFDGLVIDWQHPTKRGGRRQDRSNFSKLLQVLRTAFDKEGKGKTPLLLAAGVSAGKAVIDSAYEVENVSRYTDFLNVMAFDFHGSWDNYTGHPSQLYPRAEETGPDTFQNVDGAMKYWITKGADRSKLVLGISTYGRSFTLRNPRLNGYRVPAKGPGIAGDYTSQEGMLAYYERCNQFFDAKRVWNSDSRVPHWVAGDQWIGGEDTESVKEKVFWTRYNNLGGVMMWSLDTDDFTGNSCSQGVFPLVATAMEQSVAPLPSTVRPSTTTPEPRSTTLSEMDLFPSTVYFQADTTEAETTTTTTTKATTLPTTTKKRVIVKKKRPVSKPKKPQGPAKTPRRKPPVKARNNKGNPNLKTTKQKQGVQKKATNAKTAAKKPVARRPQATRQGRSRKPGRRRVARKRGRRPPTQNSRRLRNWRRRQLLADRRRKLVRAKKLREHRRKMAARKKASAKPVAGKKTGAAPKQGKKPSKSIPGSTGAASQQEKGTKKAESNKIEVKQQDRKPTKKNKTKASSKPALIKDKGLTDVKAVVKPVPTKVNATWRNETDTRQRKGVSTPDRTKSVPARPGKTPAKPKVVRRKKVIGKPELRARTQTTKRGRPLGQNKKNTQLNNRQVRRRVVNIKTNKRGKPNTKRKTGGKRKVVRRRLVRRKRPKGGKQRGRVKKVVVRRRNGNAGKRIAPPKPKGTKQAASSILKARRRRSVIAGRLSIKLDGGI